MRGVGRLVALVTVAIFVLLLAKSYFFCSACSDCLTATEGTERCNVIEADNRAVLCTYEGTVFNPRIVAESESGSKMRVTGRNFWGSSVTQDFPRTGETAKCIRYSLCSYHFCRPQAEDTFPVCECTEATRSVATEPLKKFTWRPRN